MFAFAMVGLLAMGPARAATDVFVLQDGTPLVSKPGVGGKILLWVDTGFPLTVVGREGDWLEVSSSHLKAGSDVAWVPAARVGSHLPGTLDIAYSQEGPATAPEGEALFLEVVGTQEIRVHAQCRLVRVRPGRDNFVEVFHETPLELDVSGPAADCTVSKLGDSGTIDVALRTATGQPVATASTYTLHGSVRLRTDGPWGGASGFRLPTQFVLLKGMRVHPFPPGNPVPPLGNPTPALGNPTPALGNPVPALGNPTPAFGNPVPSFQHSPVPAP
ncbi:MAG TPA: hypothetical protein VE914_05570 [Candidatus Angelobacter sp.]|nr:hypothetical protein [Candidatus Angelobacter sp.]